jgi:hypothetical protein
MKMIICEVYSRVCGYFRPVYGNWNVGKVEEFKERLPYDVQKSLENDIAREIADADVIRKGEREE